MGLPEFNTVPYYKTTLPISKKEVSFRPYYVGEELSFLTHLESQDKKNLTNSLVDLVKSCTKEKILDEKLSLIDFSYLLVNIRAKSKGEKVELEKECSKCGVKEPFDFDIIGSLKLINEDKLKSVIDLSDTLSVEVGVLPYTFFLDSTELEDETQSKFFLLASSIKKIIDKGTLYTKFEKEEVVEKLLKRLSITQMKTLVNGVNDLATLKSFITCECPSCKHKDEIEMEDVLSFLF